MAGEPSRYGHLPTEQLESLLSRPGLAPDERRLVEEELTERLADEALGRTQPAAQPSPPPTPPPPTPPPPTPSQPAPSGPYRPAPQPPTPRRGGGGKVLLSLLALTVVGGGTALAVTRLNSSPDPEPTYSTAPAPAPRPTTESAGGGGSSSTAWRRAANAYCRSDIDPLFKAAKPLATRSPADYYAAIAGINRRLDNYLLSTTSRADAATVARMTGYWEAAADDWTRAAQAIAQQAAPASVKYYADRADAENLSGNRLAYTLSLSNCADAGSL